MAEQLRQTGAYTVAAHIYETFMFENDSLTIEEAEHSSVQAIIGGGPQQNSQEVIAYREVDGESQPGQILRRTADGESYELVTKPKYRGVDHVRTIREYGRDPVQKIVGSMFACELIRIVNERE